MKKTAAVVLFLALAAFTGCGDKIVPNATVKVETGEALPESFVELSGSSTSSGKNSKTRTTTTSAAEETTEEKK